MEVSELYSKVFGLQKTAATISIVCLLSGMSFIPAQAEVITDRTEITNEVQQLEVNIQGKTTDKSGGAVVNKGGNVHQTNGSLKNNTAQYFGGAVYGDKDSVFGSINGSFDGNKAVYGEDPDDIGASAGGAIYNEGLINSVSGNFVSNFAAAFDDDSYPLAIGGAISNIGYIGLINADFINNYSAVDKGQAYGGAIANGRPMLDLDSKSVPTVVSINSNFIGNTSNLGGAIYNSGEIGSVNGKFQEDAAKYAGGAIFNEGKIGSIQADFTKNHSGEVGGAILNGGVITSIKGKFDGNYIEPIPTPAVEPEISLASDDTTYAAGGAINNQGEIGTIDAEFTNNHADADEPAGGAIYNAGLIKEIKGSFKDNYAQGGTNYYARGGAIQNTGGQPMDLAYESEDSERSYGIHKINADFEGNHSSSAGGAISNQGYIGDINGNFRNNYVIHHSGPDADGSTPLMVGGAISNEDEINSIKGQFDNNYIEGDGVMAGGAIMNTGEIGSVTADFNNNYIKAEGMAFGGGVMNGGVIGSIDGDFKQNHIEATNIAFGGAVKNDGLIGSLDGNYSNNKVEAKEMAMGGAVMNLQRLISEVKGKFSNNSATVSDREESMGMGGAIQNGVFSLVQENSASYQTMELVGIGSGNMPAIIADIKADFDNNTANVAGGAIGNMMGIGDIKGNFTSNKVVGDNDYAAAGGAIFNLGITGNVQGEFISNSVSNINGDSFGGAIYTGQDSIMGIRIYSDMLYEELFKEAQNIDLSDPEQKALFLLITKAHRLNGFENDNLGIVNSTFKDNSAVSTNGSAKGGAIYIDKNAEFGKQVNLDEMLGSIPNATNVSSNSEEEALEFSENLGIFNSSFYNNYAKSENGEAKGGAIYTESSLKIGANNGKTSVFDGNYTLSGGVKDQNAIYVNGGNASAPRETAVLLLKNDTYGGSSSEPVFLTLDTQTNGKIILNDKIDGVKYSVGFTGDMSGHTYVNNEINNATMLGVHNTNVTVKDPKLIQNNMLINVVSGNLNFAHVNNETVTYQALQNSGNINFNSVDVDLKNETMGRIRADIYGSMDTGTMNVNGLNIISDTEKEKAWALFAEPEFAETVKYKGDEKVYSKKYSYKVSYDINPDDDMGYFGFVRGAGKEEYNPSLYSAGVSTTSGAFSTQNQVFNYAFQHSDNLMNLSDFQRMAYLNQNKYAIADSQTGVFSPLVTRSDIAGFWLKPYTSFESVPIKRGPKVTNISYGTLLGYDSRIKTFKNGYYGALTGYLGYSGVTQNYSGIHSYQNGGLLGLTSTLYKKGFFNASTLSVGAMGGYSSTMFGGENYGLLMAGFANKTGYDIEFKEGKFIIQPNLLLSYSFANTFDYTNAQGMRIKSDPVNTIQVAPGAKFIFNTENNWQPYLSANMVWNFLDKTKVKADDIVLPGMSIRPYVQYGAGIQKNVPDKYMLFGQAMVQNGGRNGVTLSAGIRWMVGNKKQPK